jgi:hypothetical protein
MTDRKKPRVAFWATVVVVVALVGYPLSFGPACWLDDLGYLAARPVAKSYLPVFRILESGSSLGSAAGWYCRLGAKYDAEFTETRLLNAAGLTIVDGGIMWPDLLRHDTRYRSDTYIGPIAR